MSSISVRLEEDTDQLLERLKNIQNVDKAGIMNAIAEGLRTSTEERFQSQETPEGVKWKESHRAREKGGKTLIRNSHHPSSEHLLKQKPIVRDLQ